MSVIISIRVNELCSVSHVGLTVLPYCQNHMGITSLVVL